MIYMSFTWIVYISYITEGQIIVLKIHLKTCKVANTNKVTSHIRQVSSQFFLSFALWRVFVLDLGCTYSLYKCYHFLMGDLWKKWVTACQLSSKKQDLINITSWKRYWGKRLVKKKKIPTDTSKRDRVSFMRNQGDPLKFHSSAVFHVSIVRYLPIQAWQENWCEKKITAQIKHAYWGEITSAVLPPVNGWPMKTNCKVLWKLVKNNLSSLRVIGTCSIPV